MLMYVGKFSLTLFEGLYFFCAAVRFPYSRCARGDAPVKTIRRHSAPNQRDSHDLFAKPSRRPREPSRSRHINKLAVLTAQTRSGLTPALIPSEWTLSKFGLA
jgi:hypothetical protein